MASVSPNSDISSVENEPVNSVENSEVRCLMVAGSDLLEEGQWTKARQTFSKAMILPGISSNDLAELYCSRSVALLKEKYYENALEDAEKAVKMQPGWWKGHFRMGQVYCMIHMYKKAKQCCDLALEKDPSQKEVNQAVKLVEMKLRQLDLEGSDAEQEIALDLGEMSLDEYTHTDFVARKKVVIQSLEIRCRVQFRKLYKDAEKRSRQSELFGKVLRCLNHSVEVMYILNKVRSQKNVPLSLYKKLIDELSTMARLNVFDGSNILGQFHSQACSVVNHLLAMKTVFHENTCVCYVYLNSVLHAESTVPFLDTCVQQYPLNAYFLSTRAELLAYCGRSHEALRDINAAIKLDPSQYQYLFGRAVIMDNMYPSVSMPAAICAYREFIARSPEDHPSVPTAYFNISECYFFMLLSPVYSQNQAMRKENLCMARLNYLFGCDAEKGQSYLYKPKIEKLLLSVVLT